MVSLEPKVGVAIEEMLPAMNWTVDFLVSSRAEDIVAPCVLEYDTLDTFKNMHEER